MTSVSPPYRIVLDTNILLRGLLNIQSASGRVLQACDERRLILLLSKPVVAEYRAVLTASSITKRYPELTPERTVLIIRRLRYVADLLQTVRTTFDFRRDPTDAMLIELAIAGRATHLVTADNDLLSLTSSYDNAARRLRQRAPRLLIRTSEQFLNEYSV